MMKVAFCWLTISALSIAETFYAKQGGKINAQLMVQRPGLSGKPITIRGETSAAYVDVGNSSNALAMVSKVYITMKNLKISVMKSINCFCIWLPLATFSIFLTLSGCSSEITLTAIDPSKKDPDLVDKHSLTNQTLPKQDSNESEKGESLLTSKPRSVKAITWRPLGEPGAGGRMVAVRASLHDSKRILLSGDMLGLGLSLDGGKSWGGVFGLKAYEMADITWHPTDPNQVWVGSMSGPLLSKDGGRTFIEKRVGLPPIADGHFSAPIERVLFDPNNHQTLIAFGGSSRNWRSGKNPQGMGIVWKSFDEGESWARVATLTKEGSSRDPKAKEGININGMVFASESSDVLYAATRGHGVYVSRDGG
ncbi:MAG: hypothetical protein AAF558_02610, partial [Verrucomicrobiota bacterium]